MRFPPYPSGIIASTQADGKMGTAGICGERMERLGGELFGSNFRCDQGEKNIIYYLLLPSPLFAVRLPPFCANSNNLSKSSHTHVAEKYGAN